MRGTTIIMVLASLWFLVLGISILKIKKIREILENSSVANDKTSYVKFNALFNVSLGVIGIVLGIIDYFLGQYSLYIVVGYAIIMVSAGFIQSKLSSKYK